MKIGERYLIRSPGQLSDLGSIERVIVAHRGGIPITVRDVAEVSYGKQLRTGAATRDGEEAVLAPRSCWSAKTAGPAPAPVPPSSNRSTRPHRKRTEEHTYELPAIKRNS